MKAGGRRRLFIPKELGYLDGEGLGPVPSSPFRRKALGDNLDKLSAEGALVFDVTLEAIMDDEVREESDAPRDRCCVDDSRGIVRSTQRREGERNPCRRRRSRRSRRRAPHSQTGDVSPSSAPALSRARRRRRASACRAPRRHGEHTDDDDERSIDR